MPWPVIVAILAAVLVVVAAIRMAARAERARTEALQQAAVTAGLTFEAEGDLRQLQALGDLPLYSHGHSKRVMNVMSGRSGTGEVKVFDYRYTTGGGKESHTWRQTVALFPGGGRGLPDFVLAPENVLHKLGQLLGYQDIDFDSSPAFSSHYLLRGADETAIRAAFTDDVRMFLEQQQGWSVEVQAGNIGIYRSGKRVKPEDLTTFLEQAQSILRGIARR